MTVTTLPYLHRFEQDTSHIDGPKRFTFPFCYEPHPWSIMAAQQVQYYLEAQDDFSHNFGLYPEESGSPTDKMFGVLVVKDTDGILGYLAAVSGELGNSNKHSYFVHAIYDMLDPDGLFCQEELKINDLNAKISHLESGTDLSVAKDAVETGKHLIIDYGTSLGSFNGA